MLGWFRRLHCGTKVCERSKSEAIEDRCLPARLWTGLAPTRCIGSGLQPNKVQRFKLSNSPQVVEKLRDVGGALGTQNSEMRFFTNICLRRTKFLVVSLPRLGAKAGT